MVGLDSGSDRSVYNIVEGQFYYDFTALVLDAADGVIYFSDVNRSDFDKVWKAIGNFVRTNVLLIGLLNSRPTLAYA